MTERKSDQVEDLYSRLSDNIAQKEARKLRARHRKKISNYLGLSMYGMVGWSIAVTTLLGLALGYWIDSRWQSPFSWTLTLFFAGLVMGCFNAWYWIKLEQQKIEKELEEIHKLEEND